MARLAQRPLLAAEVRFGDVEVDGRGRAVDAVRVLMISAVGGGGAVWDIGRKRRQNRILLMQRNFSWSCIVPGPVDGCHARRVSQINVPTQRKACIRLIGRVRSSKGSSSHYMLCRKSYCSGLWRS